MNTKYKTRDLYLAAYLQAIGTHMEAPMRVGSRVEFVFSLGPNEDGEELTHEYFSGQGQVSAGKFAQAIKSLKSLVHS
ncbi:MAG: hypothetical protein KF764_03095 [Labilithrix sp.]|nr:hypothetical protein [Labilithrix sp.]